MVKIVDNDVVGDASPAPVYGQQTMTTGHENPEIAELVADAMARLRRDLEAYNPNKPAIGFALAGETHAVMMQQWHQRSPEEQIMFLLALREDVSGLLHQFQARITRIAPSNSYMYGQHEDAIKLEAQAEMTLEEVHRIEADLRALNAGDALH